MRGVLAMQSQRCWGDEAVADPSPPKDLFAMHAGHTLQWVFCGGKWVDPLVSPACDGGGITFEFSS